MPALQQRGLLNGGITGLLGGGDLTPTAAAATTTAAADTDPLGLGSALSGILGGGQTDSSSTPTVSLTKVQQTSASASASVSTTPTPSSSTSASATSVSLSSQSISQSTSASASAPPAPSFTSSSILDFTTSDGVVQTFTTVTLVSATPTDSAAAAASASASQSAAVLASHKGFLENAAVSAPVLSLVGIFGLAIIASLVTFVFRRSRSRKLHDEAIAWPALNDHDAAFGAGAGASASAGNNTGFNSSREALQRAKSRSSTEKYGSDESNGYGGYGASAASHGAYANDAYPARAPGQGYGYGSGAPLPSSRPMLNVAVPPSQILAGPVSPSGLTFTPTALTTPANAYASASLLNSNSGAGPYAAAQNGRRQSAFARELDPHMPQLPKGSPLPDAFGGDDYIERSRSTQPLKIANR